MRILYSPTHGSGAEFEIESDRHGSYSIKLDGKVIRRVTAITHYPGRPRWGSRKLELEAIEDAKRDIEAFTANAA
jgi:hypothetical protein